MTMMGFTQHIKILQQGHSISNHQGKFQIDTQPVQILTKMVSNGGINEI